MRISQERLAVEAQETGFRPEILEKVIHLLQLLETIQSHPDLQGHLVLKGGTALNLFLFDVPRLSVDIDLNYIGGELSLAQTPSAPESRRSGRPAPGWFDRRQPTDPPPSAPVSTSAPNTAPSDRPTTRVDPSSARDDSSPSSSMLSTPRQTSGVFRV